MHPILNVLMILLILAEAFTARESVRIETLIVASVGLLVLGAAARRRMRR